MEKTIQFNIRLDKKLVYDMEYIADYYRVQRNDWLKVKIAEMIAEEKLKIMETIEERFIQGRLTEIEFKEKMGFKPNKEMLELRKKVMGEEAKKLLPTQRYFMEAAKRIKK